MIALPEVCQPGVSLDTATTEPEPGRESGRFSFYPGQLGYLAAVAVTPEIAPGFYTGRQVAADTGCGKSLFATMLARLKLEQDGGFTGAALFVVPGGTLRVPKSDDDADDEETGNGVAQWKAELARFAPGIPVYDLTDWSEYLAAIGRQEAFQSPITDPLPPGIYITYGEALFRNGARTNISDAWLEKKNTIGWTAHSKICEAWAAMNKAPVDYGIVRHTFRLVDIAAKQRLTLTQTGFIEQFRKLLALDEETLRYASMRDIVAPAKQIPALKAFAARIQELFFSKAWPVLSPNLQLDSIERVPLVNFAEGIGQYQPLKRRDADGIWHVHEPSGIQCVFTPTLAERIECHQAIAHWNRTHGFRRAAAVTGMEVAAISPEAATPLPSSCFQAAFIDESQIAANIDSELTRQLIRLQPPWRFALSATPIPNIVTNLYAIMGWLSVPGWYLGGRRNVAWPYAREDIRRFDETFLATEEDHTQPEITKSRGRCTYKSPVISSPARLLKLIRPTLAFISKEQCNPDYRPAQFIDVRVPLGTEQAALYSRYLNRGLIPGNPLVRARRQTQWLRAITADPAGFKYGDGVVKVSTNFNPKVICILELVRSILEQGEQVVIVSARVGLTDTVAARLKQAGVRFSRIDSTVSPDRHSQEANRFKSGETDVQLLGMKCAASYSFSHCLNEIITSIEFNYGYLKQASGRVDRVNSRPGVKIYCVLNKDTMEEAMYDKAATKGDAATICLRGERVPRTFAPVDANEVLAANLARWESAGQDGNDAIATRPELQCETDWPALCEALKKAAVHARSLRHHRKAPPQTPPQSPLPALPASTCSGTATPRSAAAGNPGPITSKNRMRSIAHVPVSEWTAA